MEAKTYYILIVDDEAKFANALKLLLKQKGLEVSAVHNAQEALDFIGKNSVDLVLTDVIMPGMNGIDLTKKLNQDFPETKIVVFSGGGDSGEMVAKILTDAALDEGALQSLTKPFSREDLLERINKALGTSYA